MQDVNGGLSAFDPLESEPAIDPGDTFEEMCWNLLRRRYRQSELVYMPAQMGGDYGIEGYSTDGIAYQCYSDRDSLTLRHRTNKQKEKLYKDTVKLKTYAKKLEKVLDGTIVEHYFLMVPQYHAVELVEFAVTRAEAVRAYKLEFIADTFSIRIKTPKDYPAELKAALADGAAKANILVDDAAEDHVKEFPEEEPELMRRLNEKLSALKLWNPYADVDGLRQRFIRDFLTKEQIMNSLREWPDTYEAVERRRRLRQDDLELASGLDSGASNDEVLGVIKAYRQELLDKVAGLQEPDAHRLAYGQAGEWLMRCPLKIRKPA